MAEGAQRRGMSPDDKRTCAMAHAGLLEPFDYMHLVKRPRVKRRRLRSMVTAAEKAGKTVTSVTMPDGTVLHFGELAPTEASNPWFADLKVTKQ
jgi:hypothetical protein